MDIKMTAATAKVIQVFAKDPTAERYGRELMQATGLQSGSLYPILARLERDGVLTSEVEEVDPRAAGRPARRFYTITGEGIKAARQALAELHELTRLPSTSWLPGPVPEGGRA
ncbi:transcriptional regulator [Kitasatospora phosalacinea]|uniref:Transcriptional regulator n=1 Tax=Kitasatospora phosalacinea TaxID=2065 RepID=A0A9W6V6M5_9ACTN|nr:PadR family transcriptional regulator [Kitasatospora phosalacinea]GLW75453.1 transcriptional regulator [Kitasatospora phosalacinea]